MPEDYENDDLETTVKETQCNYRADIFTPDALESIGDGEDGDAWADDHVIAVLAHDKAECRKLGQRMLDLWHLEDQRVTKVCLEVSSLHSDYLVDYTIELPESEL